VAYDGAAGVEAVLRDHPDAVVCDLGLRKKSGLAVAAELTRRLPDKPLLIAVTAHSDDGIRDRARQAGFDHFLVKPAFPQDIAGLIRDSILSREAGSRA
jgi:CheY-like chemotaxis protein